MTSNTPEDAEFSSLLDYVRSHRGFDFTGYKRSSLMRRVRRRMQTVQVDSFSDYIDYLEVHPNEFQQLFNTLLINVTSFFRDAAAWDTIRQDILPAILECKADHDPIRVWSAGCASGEEPYTVAMLLTETLGIDQFQSRVKIYATDLDEEALVEARQATYPKPKVQGLTEEQRQFFFDASEDRYTFRKDLRRSVIFGRHDLVQDAPISKIDLLVCRNTLMYFNAETQRRILNRFHFALQDTGFLFLGKAEMMMSHSNTFVPVHLKSRIFKKVLQPNNIRDRLLIMAQTGNENAANNLSDQVRLRDAAFDNAPIARVVVERNGQLSQVNALARSLFNLSQRDVGCPLQDLEISYRPVELRGYIDQVRENRRGIRLTDISWNTPQGSVLHLEVQIEPLLANGDTFLGTSVDFIDVTRFQRLQNELEHSNQELEMAYEELQSTNEELETTNEELQSSNEELETTNEELQSTNEELETMNEELQSTNEELQTVNDELQRSSDELNQNNAFLECVFNSLNGGVVVVNPDFQVQIWTNKAHDLWGLRPEEAVGQNFLNLDIGLPVAELRQPIRNCLASSEDSASEVYLDAINRRGRAITCRISCTPLVGTEQAVQGVILIMEEMGE